MGILAQKGIERVYHYTPIHYLVFIARSRLLLSKPSLRAAGFRDTHLRSMSKGQDVARGFGTYTHLTLERHPRILRAKLASGFPHIEIAVPITAIEAHSYSLCRFNVAMTRYLRRGDKPGFPESPANGRYYDGHQIPIARADADKAAMLEEHLNAGTMIEVLIHGDLALTDETEIVCFCDEDAELAAQIVSQVDTSWKITSADAPGDYPRNPQYVEAAEEFIQRALSDESWRGNGLEFDRI